MMIVTHDMKMARDVSDHTVFLHQGLIEEQGDPETLFGAPRSDRLRQFLSSTMPD
jgi:polar amino acid transport system ATP-binding protein